MADVTTDFFQALASGGSHPELDNAKGTLRFDLRDRVRRRPPTSRCRCFPPDNPHAAELQAARGYPRRIRHAYPAVPARLRLSQRETRCNPRVEGVAICVRDPATAPG